MAGGEGVRLRPLTVNLPKPLVPLLGEPVMGYALKLLRRHGVSDVGATLWYQPRKIRAAFGKGEEMGIRLRYYEETAPLGTAGSVCLARDHLKGTFFVLSGDGLTDCDLTAALAWHREKKALATLVVRRVRVPLPYGVVMTDESGRVTRFLEKPAWSRVFSNLVNTGIYILEPEIFDHIPNVGMPDFGKDIFPSLLEKGLPMYAWEMQGYWCDVGDQRAYLSAQLSLMRGEVDLPHLEGIDPSARIDPTARLEGHCRIGRDVRIGPGARLRNAVIGDQCTVGAGAVIEGSCLWSRAVVGEKAHILGSVLCDGAAVRQGAILHSGSALGQGAVAGAQSEVRPGIRIWPHLKIAPGAVVSRTMTESSLDAPLWTGRGIACDSAESVCLLCAAYAKVTGARQVLVGCRDGAALQSIAAGALAASGVRVLQAGEITWPMLRRLVPEMRLGGGVLADGRNLRFLTARGEPLTGKQMNAMDAAVLRQDTLPAFARQGGITRFSGAEELYLSRIMPENAGKALLSPVAVFSASGRLCQMAREALEGLNARNVRTGDTGDMSLRPQETGFLISEDGEEMSVFAEGCIPSPEQKTMLLLSLLLRRTGRLYDLADVPRAAEKLAPLREKDGSPACAAQQMLLGDGLASVLMVCEALKEGPLAHLLAALPETHILIRDIPCRAQDKGRILHSLCQGSACPRTLGEGVRFRHENGCATVAPDTYKNAVRVVSESADAEIARELCDFYLDAIRQVSGGGEES